MTRKINAHISVKEIKEDGTTLEVISDSCHVKIGSDNIPYIIIQNKKYHITDRWVEFPQIRGGYGDGQRYLFELLDGQEELNKALRRKYDPPDK